ncbi:MAG: hypothetical protein ACRD2M_00820 [Terriglobales bacterium]
MRRLLTIAVLGAALTAPLYAQIHGIPPSVTSIGSGSTPMTPGIGASVTSLGPAGLVDRVGSISTVPQPHPVRPGHNFVPFFWPAIYQPQPQPLVVVVQPPPPVVVVVERDEDDDRDRREPLVLEWKGDKYVRISGDQEDGDQADASDRSRQADRKPAKKTSRKPAPRPAEPLAGSATQQRDQVPEPEAPATVLVFLDGRRKDVKNYAIVAEIFYDLSDRLPRKILLADLDLNATIAANEERGLDFRLPTASSPNQVITRP